VKISRGKMPPGGWHFMVAAGVRLEAINEEELTKRIFEYRLRHHIEIGDIERDLDTYYCGQWPEACHKEAKDWDVDFQGPNVSNHATPLLNRVTMWAAGLLHILPRGGFELGSKEEAARRGLACAGCPKNQSWRVGCRGCSNSTATVLTQLRQLRTSQQEGNLHGCEVGGWDNQTAVWLPVAQMPITPEQRAALPDRCWRKAL